MIFVSWYREMSPYCLWLLQIPWSHSDPVIIWIIGMITVVLVSTVTSAVSVVMMVMITGGSWRLKNLKKTKKPRYSLMIFLFFLPLMRMFQIVDQPPCSHFISFDPGNHRRARSEPLTSNKKEVRNGQQRVLGAEGGTGVWNRLQVADGHMEGLGWLRVTHTSRPAFIIFFFISAPSKV